MPRTPHTTLLLAVLICLAAGSFLPVGAVWPVPSGACSAGSTAVLVSDDFEIVFSRSFEHQFNVPSDLAASIARATGYLAHDGFRRVVVGRGEEDRPLLRQSHTLSRLELILRPAANGSLALNSLRDEVHKPYEDLNEEYELQIPSESDPGGPGDFVGTLSAETSLGLLRGLQTFVQLVYSLPSSSPPSVLVPGHWEAPKPLRYILNTPLAINDAPAFPHRGFMLDTSRSFYPVKDIERTLEVMSWAKLNVFHWHITDAQSFPLVFPSYPDLSAKGAYSLFEVYLPVDIARLDGYAASLGIRIMLEVDVPGHTASVAEAFPDLVACAFLEHWEGYGNEPPTGQLKLRDPSVQEFAEDIVTQAAGLVSARYFSSGGDEINSRCYSEDPAMQATTIASNASLNDALSTFVTGVHRALRKIGKVPVVWEEMVLAHDIDLDPETIVMVWISSTHVASVVNKGFKVIHAASDYFYLDCGAGGWLGNAQDLASWCKYVTWAKSYSFDPYANISADQRHLILGGQALLWSEQSDPQNLDSIAWPRAAVAAEVFWTGSTLPDGAPRHLAEALPRLHDWRYRAVQRGIRATPLQPHWCALRPGACDL